MVNEFSNAPRSPRPPHTRSPRPPHSTSSSHSRTSSRYADADADLALVRRHRSTSPAARAHRPASAIPTLRRWHRGVGRMEGTTARPCSTKQTSLPARAPDSSSRLARVQSDSLARTRSRRRFWRNPTTSIAATWQCYGALTTPASRAFASGRASWPIARRTSSARKARPATRASSATGCLRKSATWLAPIASLGRGPVDPSTESLVRVPRPASASSPAGLRRFDCCSGSSSPRSGSQRRDQIGPRVGSGIVDEERVVATRGTR